MEEEYERVKKLRKKIGAQLGIDPRTSQMLLPTELLELLCTNTHGLYRTSQVCISMSLHRTYRKRTDVQVCTTEINSITIMTPRITQWSNLLSQQHTICHSVLSAVFQCLQSTVPSYPGLPPRLYLAAVEKSRRKARLFSMAVR